MWIYMNAVRSRQSITVDGSASVTPEIPVTQQSLLKIQAFSVFFPALVLSLKCRHSGALIVFSSAAVASRRTLRLPAYCQVLKVFLM